MAKQTDTIKEQITQIFEIAKVNENKARLQTRNLILQDLFQSVSFSDFVKLQKINQTEHRRPAVALRIAVGGYANLALIVECLKFHFYLNNITVDIYESPFDSSEIQLLDSNSDLYKFDPHIIWIFNSHQHYLRSPEIKRATNDAANHFINHQKQLISVIKSTSSAQIVLNTIELPLERLNGNFENFNQYSFHHFVKEFNQSLKDIKGVQIFDYSFIANYFGLANWHSRKDWQYGKFPFNIQHTHTFTYFAATYFQSLLGHKSKVLAVDLDNTIWPGEIAENNLELDVNNPVTSAYLDFQTYIKSLKDMGVLLAIVTKNDFFRVQETFKKTQGLNLSLDDFVIVKAGWENKVKSLQELSSELNIPLQSFVFIDDSHVECKLVQEYLPEVKVILLEDDPSLLVEQISRLSLFDSPQVTEEDSKRTEIYQQDILRNEIKSTAINESDFLSKLVMELRGVTVSSGSAQRTLQLINKSNQYNVLATKLTESGLNDLLTKHNMIIRSYYLSDKYGDNGLISSVIGNFSDLDLTFTITTWVMSCRVFARHIEFHILEDLVDICRKHGVFRILGRYVPTDRNQQASNHWKKLGFIFNANTDFWELDLSLYTPPQPKLMSTVFE